jgi:16S rRNA (cytosine967-C5)-methyltransferase
MPSVRNIAVTALINIFQKSVKPKEALDGLAFNLDKRDRAFIMELVYGVLRYRDYLDWMLKGFIKKPSGLSTFTLNNLRSALYQIEYMRVPDRAAVNEAVNLERFNEGKRALVNAVLRNYLRKRDSINPSSEIKDPIEFISITTSHPKWLVKKWVERFGYDAALKLAEANNIMPSVVLRAESQDKRDEVLQHLIEEGIEAYPSAISPVGIVLRGALPNLSSILEVHNLFVQDEAAQLVAYLLNPQPKDRVLDACASPGGKTTHIAQLMKDSGEVIAVENDDRRIQRLRENISRLDLNSVRIIHADVSSLQQSGFDAILLDAPCSSLGVIRRNPDVKYRHSQKDLARYHSIQCGLLDAVSKLLKPGGIMVYSVCSTEPEEGEHVIKEFLQQQHDFCIIKSNCDFLKPFETSEGFYRTFPHMHGMDGFFAARLSNTAG